jgi:hypothetical protein
MEAPPVWLLRGAQRVLVEAALKQRWCQMATNSKELKLPAVFDESS